MQTTKLKVAYCVLIGLCCLSLLSACSGLRQTEKSIQWYESQGVSLVDCGPASAAMAVNWAGGHSTLSYARAVTRNQGWWTFDDISIHLGQQGIYYQMLSLSQLEHLLKKGHGAVVRVSIAAVPHFVFVTDFDGKTLLVADPLRGSKRLSVQELKKLSANTVMLAIYKPSATVTLPPPPAPSTIQRSKPTSHIL